MTQEEKDLLLKDLCARLPYGITIYRKEDSTIHRFQYSDITENIDQFSHFLEYSGIDDIKPYLRPMSSMTDEEELEFFTIGDTVLKITEKKHTCVLSLEQMDWLNQRCFDYRGLIPRGLALRAPKGMYTDC